MTTASKSPGQVYNQWLLGPYLRHHHRHLSQRPCTQINHCRIGNYHVALSTFLVSASLYFLSLVFLNFHLMYVVVFRSLRYSIKFFFIYFLAFHWKSFPFDNKHVRWVTVFFFFHIVFTSRSVKFRGKKNYLLATLEHIFETRIIHRGQKVNKARKV